MITNAVYGGSSLQAEAPGGSGTGARPLKSKVCIILLLNKAILAQAASYSLTAAQTQSHSPSARRISPPRRAPTAGLTADSRRRGRSGRAGPVSGPPSPSPQTGRESVSPPAAGARTGLSRVPVDWRGSNATRDYSDHDEYRV